MFILHTEDHIIFFNQKYIFIVLNFQFDMNSSRIHKIMALVQKYEILEYLSFNVFYLYCTRGNATTQNLHYTQIFYIGWPYGTCFKPIVKSTIGFRTIENDMKNKRNLRQKSMEFVECPPLSSNLRRFRTQGKS